MPKKPELLIPAGNLEKLRTAVLFGADAVYVGAGPYSLRTQQTAFTLKELKQGITFSHKHKVKLYLAMNIFAFDDDLPKMIKYLKSAIALGIDAVIVSDPGLINLIQSLKQRVKIHLSTQANTLNSEAVKFWYQQGVRRVVLGREVNLKQVKQIKSRVPKMELELFIHGAMCMSYSGRCLLSKYLTGRSANRGECSHPCRWEYQLIEPGQRANQKFGIEEDSRGTYIMNSKDLCLIEHIPELVKAGIDSFKVEGRMKPAYYVALTTKIYRQALNDYLKNPKKYKYRTEWKKELEKVSHRPYTTGFYFNENDRESMDLSGYKRPYNFVGVVENHNLEKGELEIFGRNQFMVGEELEIIDPKVAVIRRFKIESMRDLKGKSLKQAHNNYRVFIPIELKEKISPDSLLRKQR